MSEKRVATFNPGFGREPFQVQREAHVNKVLSPDSVRTRRFRRFSSITALCLILWVTLRTVVNPRPKDLQYPCTRPGKLNRKFDWFEIKPSETLKWHGCYEKYQCARLSVPLDYSQPNGEKAAVAMVKLPSKIPPGDDGYRGPILFNPGGPGGSGVSTILARGESFRAIIGDDYDFIGFDPRGVNFTTPSLDIFKTEVEQKAWAMDRPLFVNATVDALGLAYSQAQVLGQLAKDRTQHSAEHVSTPVVARDMLSIIKAHGQDKLQYWGFSYGTVLGATYAAMFPDNVERLIIDGVVDSENYYGTLWSNNLRDIDGTLLNLYDECVAAGPDACPLYEKSPLLIKARVDKLLNGLKIAPVSFYNSTSGLYDVIDFSVVKGTVFSSMYRTHLVGKNLTIALAELEKGNAEPIWTLGQMKARRDALNCDCSAEPEFLPSSAGAATTLAIACSDGDNVKDDIPALQAYFEDLAKTSSFADVWTTIIRAGCTGWKVRAKERFNKSFSNITTSFPLLLIGNTLDPVTPLWNAHKMSKAFEDSVVLTQNSPG
ncbi:alpha/beta-hydrolase, partial [Rickenella mellea]